MSERYRSAWRGYLIDHHSPPPPVVDFSRLDIDEYRAFLRTSSITSLMMYCKDHWGYSYYDTGIGTRHPGLGQDWVRAVAEVLRDERIEFNAYYCLEYDTLAPVQHPDWSIVDRDGAPVRLAGRMAKWGMACYETGYRRYVLGQLTEIVTAYGPDSLFLDIFGKSLCYCDACRARFREEYGYPLPVAAGDNVDEYQAYDFGERGRDVNAFLDDCASRMLDDVIATVKAVDPAIAVTINFAALYPKSIRDRLDYQFTEPWAGNWLSACYSRDTARGQYPQLGPGDVSEVYNYRPQNVYTLAAAQIAAAGCRVFFYSGSQHVDGTLEHEEARRVGRAYAELSAFEPYLEGRDLVAEVAIIQSDTSVVARSGSGVIANAIGRCKKPDRHREAVLGAMQCCDAANLCWTVLPEQDADAQTLGRFRLVILAGLYHIGQQLADALRGFVAAGGALIADDECGLFETDGSQRPDFAIADVLGCSYRGRLDRYAAAEWGGYVAPVRHSGNSESDGNRPVLDASRFWSATPDTYVPAGRVQYQVVAADAHHPVAADAQPLEHAPGARTVQVLGRIVAPAVELTDTTWVNWWCPPPQATWHTGAADEPGPKNQPAALVASTFGTGRTLYLAWDLFRDRVHGLQLVQGVFAGAAAALLPDPAISLDTTCPQSVSFAAYTRGMEILVHVVSHLAERTNGEAPPVAPGTLKLSAERFAVKHARLVTSAPDGRSDESPLAVGCEAGGSYELVLPPVTVHYLVVVTCAAQPVRP